MWQIAFAPMSPSRPDPRAYAGKAWSPSFSELSSWPAASCCSCLPTGTNRPRGALRPCNGHGCRLPPRRSIYAGKVPRLFHRAARRGHCLHRSRHRTGRSNLQYPGTLAGSYPALGHRRPRRMDSPPRRSTTDPHPAPLSSMDWPEISFAAEGHIGQDVYMGRSCSSGASSTSPSSSAHGARSSRESCSPRPPLPALVGVVLMPSRLDSWSR